MKQSKGFGLVSVIIIIVLTSIIAGITTGVIMLNGNEKSTNIKDKNIEEFISVYETLISKYYDKVDKEGMINAAEEAMVNYLGDKYTTYLEDEEYQDIIDELSSTYEGIGVTVLGNIIYSVTENSPASKAGILIGDKITAINGESVEGKTSSELASIIKNGKEKTITVTILRGEDTLNFTLEKETLINPATEHRVIENTSIGYLAITKFSENLGKQVSDALKDLESKNITSLIIDLRDDVGGYLTSVETVASLFIEEGKVIYTLKANDNSFTYKDETKEKREYPIVVLINKNSASAAEILAAALKDSYGATLVGVESYGKGKVQQVAKLENGDSVKYTSAKWYTPNDRCIDGIGIYPDYYIELAEDGTDTQLQEAIELLS